MPASARFLSCSNLKYLVLLGLLALTACAPRATPAVPTLGPLYEQTLPPSWTPENTATTAPTHTRTSTPTATPTPSIQALCAQFSIAAAPQANAAIEANGAALFAWKGVPDNVHMVLSITLHGSIAGLRADVPISGDGVFPIPMIRLPVEGRRYDWSAYLVHPAFRNICQHGGSFFRLSTAF